MEGHILHRLEQVVPGGVPDVHQALVLGAGDAALRDLAPVVALHHVQGAVEQVAEIVGQIAVDPVAQGHLREVAVLAEGDLPQQEEAEGVEAVPGAHVDGIDHVAQGLAHLLAVFGPPAVGEDLLGQGQLGAHQEAGPEHGVEPQDVLADDVHGLRPELGVALAVEAAEAADVVGQGVEPDVDHVLRIVGDVHAPREVGPADGEILQAALDEAHDLVVAARGPDPLGVGLQVGQQGRAVRAELEEVAGLLHPGHLVARGGLAVHQLVLGEVGLVADAVPALVLAEVDVALGLHAPPHLSDHLLVAILGGADEVVIADLEVRPHLAEAR